MPKAKKLPSGNWRVQVSTGKKDENGKYKYISITRPTEKEALYAALEFDLKHKTNYQPLKMTLKEACEKYVANKTAILSPSTITGYKRLIKNNLQGLMDVPLEKLTMELIQNEINIESIGHSPKTVRNIHGFLSSVLKEFHSDFVLRTKLPQKQQYIPNVPTHEEVKKILKCTKGTSVEVPVLFAVWLGLRMSEIRGLKYSDINLKNETITIKRAIVDADGGAIEKQTKTYSGTRTLPIPPYIINKLQIKNISDKNAFICPLGGKAIYKKFSKLLEDNEITHFRFHDLRHINATIMLSLNIPDKYAMKRMGHSTPNMLKNVYQHIMSDEEKRINDVISDYFENFIDDD